MLLGGHRGYADEDRQDQGQVSHCRMKIPAVPDADPAEPAGQAVDGREKVVRGICHVDKAQCQFPDGLVSGYGTNQGRRQDQKEYEADKSGKGIGCKKPVPLESACAFQYSCSLGLSVLLSAKGNYKIEDEPDKIAGNVDDYGAGHCGYHEIQRRCHVRMVPAGSYEFGTLVDPYVYYEGHREGDQYVFYQTVIFHCCCFPLL